jgi:16S rRNA (adenine1518-N6/adenine1519-N6)-dimethyltransferase
VKRVLRAPPGAFHPPPEVTSAVVTLRPLHPPRAHETERFRTLVRRAFEARRKTLRNAWSGLAPDAAALQHAAEEAGVSLDVRGETLDVEAFARMDAALGRRG